MSRALTAHATVEAERFLSVLTDEDAPPVQYREAMTMLGRILAKQMLNSVPSLVADPVCLVCTAEDADFLARGILEGLETGGVDRSRLKLVCYWNERVRSFDQQSERLFDVAPITKAYREEVDVRQSTVIVVKSIISGACVVKTNLTALLDRVVPERVLVAAPVMLEGAEQRLASEFPKGTADRFAYFTFAVDDQKSDDGEVVIPGIGGSVYKRLGFDDKTKYMPKIVLERRRPPSPTSL